MIDTILALLETIALVFSIEVQYALYTINPKQWLIGFVSELVIVYTVFYQRK